MEGSCCACSRPQCEGTKVALPIVSMRAKGQVKYHITLASLRFGKHQNPLFYSTTLKTWPERDKGEVIPYYC